MTKKTGQGFYWQRRCAVLLCVLPFALAMAQEADPSFVVSDAPAPSVPASIPPDEDTLLCNEEYPECIWVREGAAQGTPFVEQEEQAAEDEEGTMMLEWRSVPSFGSPKPAVGDCSRTVRRLLDKAADDFAGSNPNRVLENIDWSGRTSQTVDPLVDRVLALMGSGQWEHQEVVASYGELDPKQVRDARRTLRWVLPGSTQTFVLRERLGCWLLSPSP